MTSHVQISSFECLPVGQQTWYAEKSYWHQRILSLVQRVKCGALSSDRPLATELNNLNGPEIMSICAVGSKQSRSVCWRHE